MNYDEVYTFNPEYFGNPFPKVIEYFERQKDRGKVLDVGCGQGRNAIPMAKMGYQVHAIDISPIAVNQLKTYIETISIDLKVEQKDFNSVVNLDQFDYILLDGFFHFYDRDRADDEAKMHRLLESVRADCKLVFCFADHSDAVSAFRQMTAKCDLAEEAKILYEYIDPVSEWKFETNYFFAVLRLSQ